eukprot:COSAG02_NODE_4122_length_5744_cov_18.406909_3_plen_93_part_00
MTRTEWRRWIGTPSGSDIEAIQSGVLRKILGDWTTANPLPGKGLATKYSSATADAITLLESMLQFNPAGRCVRRLLDYCGTPGYFQSFGRKH